MQKILFSRLQKLFQLQVPATGLGLFRLLFGLVCFQEILFLLYFNHLIFDPIPYLDVEFPMIPSFLFLWLMVAAFVTAGYRTQAAIIANYVFWIIFVQFTPMQRDFDGGFDLFMTGTNFFLIFLPVDKAFSIDMLRKKLSRPFVHYSQYRIAMVAELTYVVPIAICLGFLYFDSAIHKLFAPHWRNGLGAWLPSSMPFYVSALDMSWLLDNEILQKTIGYTIIVFQFSFVFLFHNPWLRPFYFVIGAGLHLGITLSFNIYPFGLGMLVFYALVAPPGWYARIGQLVRAESPLLTVFYDEQCPLCNRTVLILNHFDVFACIEFKGAQTYAADYPALANILPQTLMQDLYALDRRGKLYSGVDTYAQIMRKMRYPFLAGLFLQLPGVYQLACHIYRRIADSRARVNCNEFCRYESERPASAFYVQLFETDSKTNNRNLRKLSKILIAIFLLQLNSSIHYGVFYRIKKNNEPVAVAKLFVNASNSLIMLSQTLLGITPHALYLHDHFAGYNHLIALTYIDSKGEEKWLPFVNEQGRMLAPNWGRVHSMWANIAVTPDIDNLRLKKFIMKVTAFWGARLGLALNQTQFIVKMKKIAAPYEWRPGLLNSNLSGEWDNIGHAEWHGKEVNIVLPDNINLL